MVDRTRQRAGVCQCVISSRRESSVRRPHPVSGHAGKVRMNSLRSQPFLAAALATTIGGCGGSSPPTVRTVPATVPARAAARCPRTWSGRSSPSTRAIAPDSPSSTALCVYAFASRSRGRRPPQSRYPGGLLDRALNDSFQTVPRNLICLSVARAPATVILAYKTAVRYVALDIAAAQRSS